MSSQRLNGHLLSVDNLDIRFQTANGTVHAVRDLSFAVRPGETVAIVGESGCGKSVTAMSILQLVPTPPARIEGAIWFDEKDLLKIPYAEVRRIRGKDISMVFQEPATSLNPVLTVGRQIREVISLHEGRSRNAANRRAAELLEMVGISEPYQRLASYPHQLSGGMRQRVMIAAALACGPRLLIADEPTTALDVTIQAQILDLMRDLKTRINSAILLITHDLGIVAEMAERVIIMYAGRKVEEADAHAIFTSPRHPYTRGLLAAVPKLGAASRGAHAGKLADIPGTVPSLLKPIVGCAFAPRCPLASDLCKRVSPRLEARAMRHLAACHHSDQLTPV